MKLTSYIQQEITPWSNDFVDRIRKEMAKAGVNASNNLSNSLEWEYNGNTWTLWAAPYFQYAEVGRTAGKIPRYFATILTQWIHNKGIAIPSNFKNIREFSFAIAYKIKRYGSARNRRSMPRVDLLEQPMKEYMPKLDNIVGQAVIYYINDNLVF